MSGKKVGRGVWLLPVVYLVVVFLSVFQPQIHDLRESFAGRRGLWRRLLRLCLSTTCTCGRWVDALRKARTNVRGLGAGFGQRHGAAKSEGHAAPISGSVLIPEDVTF